MYYNVGHVVIWYRTCWLKSTFFKSYKIIICNENKKMDFFSSGQSCWATLYDVTFHHMWLMYVICHPIRLMCHLSSHEINVCHHMKLVFYHTRSGTVIAQDRVCHHISSGQVWANFFYSSFLLHHDLMNLMHSCIKFSLQHLHFLSFDCVLIQQIYVNRLMVHLA